MQIENIDYDTYTCKVWKYTCTNFKDLMFKYQGKGHFINASTEEEQLNWQTIYDLDHELAKTSRKLQEGIRPLWKKLADGCDPARETGSALDRAGFEHIAYEQFGQPEPFGCKIPHIAGEAVK